MDLTILLLTLLFIALLLTLLVWAYLRLYARQINRALQGREKAYRHLPEPRHMLKVALLIMLLIAVMLVAAAAPSWQRFTTAADLEHDARKMGSVGEDWLAEVAMHEDIAGVLLYPADFSKATFAVYLNRGKYLDNYIFAHGGSSGSIERGVHSFHYADGTIVFSLNELQIAKVVTRTGEIYDLDPHRPFVIALSCNSFDLYDAAGVLIDPQQIPYEKTEK